APVGAASALCPSATRFRSVALLAAGSVDDSVAAPEALLDCASRRAAVAAGGIAVVALLGAAHDAVAAAGNECAGVAAGVTVVRVAVVAPLAGLDDPVATDSLLRRQLDLDELAAAEPLLHCRLLGPARPWGAVWVEEDRAHEAATRRHGVGAEAFGRRVEADERVRRRSGDPDIARLTVRVERVGLLGVAVARRPGDPRGERVDLPALDRGIEAAEH